MNSLLVELKAACHERPAAGDAEKLREGESIWLVGHPVAAEEGYIGLSISDGHAVIISESAIREVDKDGSLYMVRVQAGTSALVRSETVTTLRDAHRGCGCSGMPAPSGVARTAAGGNTGSGPIIIQCPLVCRIDEHCEFYITKSGLLRRICIPFISCRRECPSQPA